MNKIQAAQNQMRELLLKTGRESAAKLASLTSDEVVAVLVSGGLVLIEDTARRLRFGSPLSSAVAFDVGQGDLELWNRRNPNHQIKFARYSEVLRDECVRCFALLHTLDALEDRS